MDALLQNQRRPDISFSRRRGIISVSARVARALDLSPGDALVVTRTGAEYLLHAIRPQCLVGRFEAQCYPTKKGSRNFRAYCVRLCRAVLDEAGITADMAAFAVGHPLVHHGKTFLPIITLNPIWTKK